MKSVRIWLGLGFVLLLSLLLGAWALRKPAAHHLDCRAFFLNDPVQFVTCVAEHLRPETPHKPEPLDPAQTSWHPLTAESGHHHGVNPNDYTDIFGPTLRNYLAEYGEISYPWLTPNENLMKHEGYVWLYTQAAGGCEQLGSEQRGQLNCVTDVLVQVHSIGTPMAVATRVHSFVLFARVCDPAGQPCGIVQTGGHHDYGILHCPYKEAHCPLESDPEGLPPFEMLKHQPPYRTNHIEPRNNGIVQFWNSLRPNSIIMNCDEGDTGVCLFPHEPNHLAGLAWSSHDAWGVVQREDVAGSPLVCPAGDCDFNHSRFQIFTVRLYELPAGPFTGWTNRWGHIVEGCTTAGTDCVPLVLAGEVPAGDALLNRRVRHSDEREAPILDFDVYDENGEPLGWLRPPAHYMEIP